MKVLIINTVKEKQFGMSGVDSAITFELYKKYRVNSNKCHLHITANHCWSKFTFIDEKENYIGTFNTMEELIASRGFVGNTLILTHEQWLDKQNPNWRTVPRYQYW